MNTPDNAPPVPAPGPAAMPAPVPVAPPAPPAPEPQPEPVQQPIPTGPARPLSPTQELLGPVDDMPETDDPWAEKIPFIAERLGIPAGAVIRGAAALI